MRAIPQNYSATFIGVDPKQRESRTDPLCPSVIQGTNVFVDWNWGGFSAFLDICELQVDRGDNKGFVALAFDTTPGYTDTTPFPTAPVKWTYQAIYRVGDSRVGQWSKPVSVTVGG